VRRAEPVKLRLRLRNRWGYPFKNYHYKIKIAGIVQTGRTDDMGQIEVPSLPVDAERGVLFAWLVDKEGAPTGLIRWELLLGHLDPNEEMSGVQGRTGLWGRVVGAPCANFKAACRSFPPGNQTIRHVPN
jgi:hypothetical protein